MRLSREWRFAAVGVFAGAALVAGLGAEEPTAKTDGPPQVGRFQVATSASDGGRFAAFVVDTATGQVWTMNDGTDTFAKSKLRTK